MEVQHLLKIFGTSMIVESVAKGMCRGAIHKYFYSKVKSSDDKELVDKTMGVIRERVESLANQVLSQEEATALLERNDSDSESDEGHCQMRCLRLPFFTFRRRQRSS